MPGSARSGLDGSGPGRAHSRFFCNVPRKISLACAAVAFVALVIGAGFAEISSNGAPTTLETAVVRYVVVAALLVGVTAYAVGGRMRENGQG